MALRASGSAQPTGDSVLFWKALAGAYASNPYVFYELYNEPHDTAQAVFASGGGQYEGMLPMAQAVAALSPRGMVLVAGAQDYAYDADSLVALSSQLPVTLAVAWVFHPYMGPYQASDAKKTVDGFASMLDAVAGTGRPVIATEFGQYCCPANGTCYLYGGTYAGEPMGYVAALLRLMAARGVSYTAWAWRPGQGGDCSQPDVNAGGALTGSTAAGGADWAALWPATYSSSTAAPATAAPAAKATTTPTQRPWTKAPTQPVAPPTGKPSLRPATSASPSTSAPNPTPPPSPVSACAARYAQCGGNGFAGPTLCCAGSLCAFTNQWYSQCVPQTAPPNGSCGALWAQCGGIGFAGPTACCAGGACAVTNAYYSQCTPAE